MTPFYTNLIVPGLLLFLLVASQIRLRFSLRLTYPLAAKPRQPFNKADWPFCLRLALLSDTLLLVFHILCFFLPLSFL